MVEDTLPDRILPSRYVFRNKKPGQLLKLLKPVYGRPDAPRAWYNELARILEQELGFSKCRTDPAMFVLRDEDSRLRGLVLVHVDDVMYCHDGGELGKRVEESLTKRSPFSTWLQVCEQQSGVTYCGKEVKVITKEGETPLAVFVSPSASWQRVGTHISFAFPGYSFWSLVVKSCRNKTACTMLPLSLMCWPSLWMVS